MARSVLTSKGQVTIPKKVREHLDLKVGDPLEFIIQETGSVIVKPAVINLNDLRGLLSGKTKKTVSVEEMNRAVKSRYEKRK